MYEKCIVLSIILAKKKALSIIIVKELMNFNEFHLRISQNSAQTAHFSNSSQPPKLPMSDYSMYQPYPPFWSSPPPSPEYTGSPMLSSSQPQPPEAMPPLLPRAQSVAITSDRKCAINLFPDEQLPCQVKCRVSEGGKIEYDFKDPVCGSPVNTSCSTSPGDYETLPIDLTKSQFPVDPTYTPGDSAEYPIDLSQMPDDGGDDSVFDDETLGAVQEAMGAVGSVVLVRFVDNRVWFTFSDSQTALKAVSTSPLKVRINTTV